MGKSFNTGRLGNGLFTDANGNVGINTTTLTSGIPFSINVATGNNCNIAFQENASDKWYIRNITSSNAFSFYSVAGSTEVMRLTSDNKVGINETSPLGVLHARGTASADSLYRLEPTSNSYAAKLLMSSRSSGDGGIRYGSGGGNNLDIFSYDTMRFYCGTTNISGAVGDLRMSITQSGNVGIGTSSPQVALDVINSGTYQLRVATSTGSYSSGKIYFGGYATGDPYYYGTIGWDQSDITMRIGAQCGNGTGGIAFYTASGTASQSERMRITSQGYIYLGDGYSSPNHRINLATGQGNRVLVVSGYNGSNNDTAIFYGAGGANPNAAATALGVTTNSSTGRSISAGGGIYASGNDYAEYMTKAITENISKGDIVGVNNNGKLTNIFADAISFVVKSTDPSYIGGDIWGNEEALGEKRPIKTTEQTEEEFAPILAEFEAKLEEARSKVDRIAFSGQVPCNVYNAQVGDYIIPINDNGKISGQAVTNPTFEQYQISVGKVWKIMGDGRAWIAVKIG